MVTLTDLKEVLGIDPGDISEDHYLQNLIRRASFRISSACNRQLEYSELIEYFSCNNSDKLYLKNWPVWEILQLQEFNSGTGDYEDIITGSEDTIANSVYIYEGRIGGLIRLLKNYKFGINSSHKSGSDYNVRIKYRAGYKNILGSGKIEGIASTNSVEGYDTLFTKEVRNGDRIIVNNFEYSVSEVVDDSIMVFSTNIEQNFQDAQYRICNIPGDLSDAVLILSASAYILRKYESYGMEQKSLNFLALTDKQIQAMIDDSRSLQVVRMKFKDFDFSSVVEAYRRLNV